MSNYTNFSVKSRQNLKDFTMIQLGYPLIQVEVTEAGLDSNIDQASEIFTKYVVQEKKYLALDLSGYDSTSGFLMPEGVTSVYTLEDSFTNVGGSVGDLMSTKNVLWNAGSWPVCLGSIASNNFRAGGLTSLELVLDFSKLLNRMLGNGIKYEYNSTSRRLTIDPDPTKDHIMGWITLGCNIIRPDDQQFGEEWIKRMTLALTKILVGRVRTKYTGVNLLGGGQIDAKILDEGITERDKLMEEIMGYYHTPMFFVG